MVNDIKIKCASVIALFPLFLQRNDVKWLLIWQIYSCLLGRALKINLSKQRHNVTLTPYRNKYELFWHFCHRSSGYSVHMWWFWTLILNVIFECLCMCSLWNRESHSSDTQKTYYSTFINIYSINYTMHWIMYPTIHCTGSFNVINEAEIMWQQHRCVYNTCYFILKYQ